jgi:hypothetical protein
MKQFCGSLDQCDFGADMVCVYCDRKITKAQAERLNEEYGTDIDVEAVEERELFEDTNYKFPH